jgi:hypothetical protein
MISFIDFEEFDGSSGGASGGNTTDANMKLSG